MKVLLEGQEVELKQGGESSNEELIETLSNLILQL